MLVRNLFRVMSTAVVCLCGLTSVTAQSSEQFYMKNGSVLEGFIAEQVPGKSITIQSDRATMVVRADSLRSKVIEYIPVESLSKEWKKWGVDNNKFTDISGVQHLELTTLEFKHVTYPNVFLLEKGSIIKFIDIMPNKYKFSWGSMYRTVKQKHPVNLFSGITETLVLTDGTKVKGQIIEQFPGKDMKILTKEKQILSFNPRQVEQIISEKLNADLPLWPQLELLDRIQLKSGKKVLEGFIISRTLGKEFRMVYEDGTSVTVPMEQIVSYGKVKNPKFAPVYDRILKKNQFCVNGILNELSVFDKKKENLYLREINAAQVHINVPVCVEANLEDPDATITVVKLHNERIKITVGQRTKKVLVPVTTYQEVVQSDISYTRDVTYLGNTKLTFILKEKGFHMVYIKGMPKQLVINAVDY